LVTIRQIEFELEKAKHGMGLPYDAERVMQLRNMLREARKRRAEGETGAGAEMTTLTIRRKALAKQEEVSQIPLTKSTGADGGVCRPSISSLGFSAALPR
jgi:hypothetical protein